jgi:small subunit ribosomal protein S7
MSRRGRATRRLVAPDPKYGSELVGRFINKLMLYGKKSTAQRIFYQALEITEKRLSKPGIEVFEQAVRNITPLMEVRPRRVGGSTYQVPMEVRTVRRQSLALRWLTQAARKRMVAPWHRN